MEKTSSDSVTSSDALKNVEPKASVKRKVSVAGFDSTFGTKTWREDTTLVVKGCEIKENRLLCESGQSQYNAELCQEPEATRSVELFKKQALEREERQKALKQQEEFRKTQKEKEERERVREERKKQREQEDEDALEQARHAQIMSDAEQEQQKDKLKREQERRRRQAIANQIDMNEQSALMAQFEDGL